MGGIITLPLTIPANVASVLFLQLRMVAAIAHIRGFDLKSEQVRGLAFACLAGSAVTDVLKDAGVKIGVKLSQQALQHIGGATLARINQAVGFRLLTKAGTTGVVNLSRLVPFVGGAISAAVDATTTGVMGSAAKHVFVIATAPDTEPTRDGPSESQVDATAPTA